MEVGRASAPPQGSQRGGRGSHAWTRHTHLKGISEDRKGPLGVWCITGEHLASISPTHLALRGLLGSWVWSPPPSKAFFHPGYSLGAPERVKKSRARQGGTLRLRRIRGSAVSISPFQPSTSELARVLSLCAPRQALWGPLQARLSLSLTPPHPWGPFCQMQRVCPEQNPTST